jgi:hypothetical protein
MFAVEGHGRSFGNWSRVGPRGLPGIVSCLLWENLVAQPMASTARPLALITDIGNDLLYGIEPDQIAVWIETCLQRLQAFNAHIVVTSLPMTSVQKLTRTRFDFLKSLLFPGSLMSFDEVEPKMLRLNQRVVDLTRTYHATLVEKRDEWYGLDPIHIRRRCRATAWREILRSWFDDPNDSEPHADERRADGPHKIAFQSVGLNRSLRLWRQRPAVRRWRGQIQQMVQPALREPDGAALWLF